MTLINNFIYSANPARVLFGEGTINSLADELNQLNAKNPLIISTPNQKKLAEFVASILNNNIAGMYTNATIHTPTEVTSDALKIVQKLNVDCIVAIGGGSTIGLAKALALRTDINQIAIPTTYAGSEMTPIIGQTENSIKTTQKTNKVLPETVIYDVNLSINLPVNISITSGINALAHAIEAIYAENKNPIISAISKFGIQALFSSLPNIYTHPNDKEARKEALYGAWLCSIALGSAGMALHHKICHTLGGSFNLPHAQTHAIMLPHTAGFNSLVVSELDEISYELTNKPMGESLFELINTCKVVYKLEDIGMKKEDIDSACDIAMTNSYYNPRTFNKEQLHELLANAFEGNMTNLKLQ